LWAVSQMNIYLRTGFLARALLGTGNTVVVTGRAPYAGT
jgi:hypothetical protein